MNKKISLTLLITFVSVLSLIVFWFFFKQNDLNTVDATNKNKETLLHNVTLVGPIKDSSNIIQGNLYATYITKDIFSSLYLIKKIDGKNIVIFKANGNGFLNTNEIMTDSVPQGFYGYRFSIIDQYHFKLSFIDKDHLDQVLAEDIGFVWDSKHNVLKIDGPGIEDLTYVVGTLTSKNGVFLGNIRSVAIDDSKKDILYSIFVVGTDPENVISEVIRNTFSNKISDKVSILKNDNDFHGFKLLSIDGDNFVIQFVDDKGVPIFDKVTIKWNYEKKYFELQK
jgi:hypothetical protein